MTTVHTHGAGPHLPVPLDMAGVILVVGFVVFAVIAYDFYRHWSHGVSDSWR